MHEILESMSVWNIQVQIWASPVIVGELESEVSLL